MEYERPPDATRCKQEAIRFLEAVKGVKYAQSQRRKRKRKEHNENADREKPV